MTEGFVVVPDTTSMRMAQLMAETGTACIHVHRQDAADVARGVNAWNTNQGSAVRHEVVAVRVSELV